MKQKTFILLLTILPLLGQAQKTYPYIGPAISLNENKVKVTSVGALQPEAKTGFQGMAIYNDWLVSLEHSGVATLYQLKKEKMVFKGTFKLGSYSKSNHCNSAVQVFTNRAFPAKSSRTSAFEKPIS